MQKLYQAGILFFLLHIFSITPCSDYFNSATKSPQDKNNKLSPCIKTNGFWVHAQGENLYVSELDHPYFQHPHFKDIDKSIKATIYAEILIKKAKIESANNLIISKKSSSYHSEIINFLDMLKHSSGYQSNYQKICIAQPILYDLEQLLNDYKKIK